MANKFLFKQLFSFKMTKDKLLDDQMALDQMALQQDSWWFGKSWSET